MVLSSTGSLPPSLPSTLRHLLSSHNIITSTIQSLQALPQSIRTTLEKHLISTSAAMRITIAILALTSRLCCAALGSHMTLLSSVPVIFPFWHGNIAHGHVASKCRDVTFTVSATAENQVAADPPPDLLNLDASLTFLAQTIELTTVSGTQKLYGQYCEPTVKNHSRAKTLQFLVHGITYDHTYWAGFQTIPSSALYSWVNFANAQGYPTLAIDRLGNGRYVCLIF